MLELELAHNRPPINSATLHATFNFLLDDLDRENEDPETIRAYEESVRRLSIIYDNPNRDYVFKFAAKVGPRFVKLLEQNDPRTLTIVGYFFMLLKIMDQVWWLPRSTGDEFESLMKLLPEEWKPRMQWAAQVFEDGSDVGDSPISNQVWLTM